MGYRSDAMVSMLFDSLPDDVILAVLRFLKPVDIHALASVSVRFSQLCNEEGLWRSLCERDFGLTDRRGPRLLYRMLSKQTHCQASFRAKNPDFHGFTGVEIGRGVRYNAYDSTYQFSYPVTSGALFLTFYLNQVPKLALSLKVKHQAFQLYPTNNPVGKAYVDLLMNDIQILDAYSPAEGVYTTEMFDLPSTALSLGENTIRWNYRIGSTAYYWIQEVEMRPKSVFCID